MEKKTTGGFISALRKANGMTQKDLAERLNISDKSVSRWECDEGAPDLSLILVIAEIFGVTCDELLRGERKSPEQRAETTVESEPSPKAEKQLQRILKSAMSQYKTRTYIAMGISVLGFIATLICNLTLPKASLGFLVGAVFFAASIVLQIVFLNRAMSGVDEEEFQNLSGLNGFKRDAIRLVELSVGLNVIFVGFTFPLVLINAYLGLSAESVLFFGIIGMMAFFAIYAVVVWFMNARLLKNGVYVLSEKEAPEYHYNHKLQKIMAIVLAALVAITAIVHEISTSTFWITEEITFDDYDSFVEFMELDIPNYIYDGHTISEIMKDDTTIYKDVYGNEISDDEFRHNTLFNNDGKVLCDYILRNGLVARIEPDSDADMLPISVYYYQYPTNRDLVERDMLFGAIYCLEVIGILLLYLKKRKKHIYIDIARQYNSITKDTVYTFKMLTVSFCLFSSNTKNEKTI